MKKIGFGIIGAGFWGRAHAEVYSTHPMAALTAVCDTDVEKARDLAAQHGSPAVYGNLEALMEDPAVDAVAVVTPDFAHCAPILAAARAGKDVLVEKPLATTAEDLDRIVEAVKGSGVRCMVDFHNRWSPPIVVARQSIAAEELGRIVSAYVRLNDTIHVPTQMLSWAADSSILWFLGSHAVDTLRFLSGDEVERVYAVARSGVLSARGIEAPDVYQAILEFRSGMIATTENNWIVPDTNPSVNDFKINVLGSKGMLSLDLTHSQLIEKYLAKSAVRPDVLVAPCIHGKRPGFAYESIRTFVDCVAQDRPLPVTLEDGVRVSKVILAMFQSAAKREPVAVQY
jgi:predicted dehydrogenase